MTKKRKELLNEDFLSDMEQKTVSAEDVAGVPENVAADDDFADLLGGTAKSQSVQMQDAQEDIANTVATLKDTVNGLAVSMNELKDALLKQAAATAEPTAPAEPAPEVSPDAPPNVDLDSAPAEQTPAEEPAAPAEPEDKPADSAEAEDKPADSESAPAEDDSSMDEHRPEDDTKTEAYRMNRKAGKLLNSNSGSVIGIVESGKLYKLDERIMAAVKCKISKRIEEAKKALKAEFLKEASEMPKAEAEVVNEEAKVEEAKSSEKKPTMSFLEKIKAAKACKNGNCSDDKCDESKKDDKCSDKSSDPEEDKDGKKKEH